MLKGPKAEWELFIAHGNESQTATDLVKKNQKVTRGSSYFLGLHARPIIGLAFLFLQVVRLEHFWF